MKTTLTRWGNSLAVRIPKALADEIELREGRPLDIRVARGNIVIKPVVPCEYELDELLAGMTKENLHGETLSDDARGAEAW